MEQNRPVALLVTHGVLGQELVRTVETILGAQHDVIIVSNNGLSADGLTDAIESGVSGVPFDRPIVLFSDLAAGSCGIATRRAALRDRVVRRASGINLPMLIEFFHYRDTLPLDELLPRIEAKGKAGIVVR
jgi:mannose/fructose-specific phosphotransferase system component IIA